MIRLTDSAKSRLQQLHQKYQQKLRLSVRRKGCAGLIYEMNLTDALLEQDEKVDIGDFSLYLDYQQIVYLIGTDIDYVDDLEGQRFVFSNTALTACGCGHSFRLEADL